MDDSDGVERQSVVVFGFARTLILTGYLVLLPVISDCSLASKRNEGIGPWAFLSIRLLCVLAVLALLFCI